jgi:hypothetical protein
VQEAGAAQVAQGVGVEAQAAADPDRDVGDALGVARGERRLGVDDAGERLGDPVQAARRSR